MLILELASTLSTEISNQPAGRSTYCQSKFRQGSFLLEYFQKNLSLQSHGQWCSTTMKNLTLKSCKERYEHHKIDSFVRFGIAYPSLLCDLGEEVRGGDEPGGRLRDAGGEGRRVVLVAAVPPRGPPPARRRRGRHGGGGGERGGRHQPDVRIHGGPPVTTLFLSDARNRSFTTIFLILKNFRLPSLHCHSKDTAAT